MNEITVTWLDEMQPPQEAVEGEAQRLAAILGDEVRLTLEQRGPRDRATGSGR